MLLFVENITLRSNLTYQNCRFFLHLGYFFSHRADFWHILEYEILVEGVIRSSGHWNESQYLAVWSSGSNLHGVSSADSSAVSEPPAPGGNGDFFPWLVSLKCTFLPGWKEQQEQGRSFLSLMLDNNGLQQSHSSEQPSSQEKSLTLSSVSGNLGKCWKKWSWFRYRSPKGSELPQGHHSQGAFKNSQVEIQISFPRDRILPGFQTNNAKSRDYPALESVAKI